MGGLPLRNLRRIHIGLTVCRNLNQREKRTQILVGFACDHYKDSLGIEPRDQLHLGHARHFFGEIKSVVSSQIHYLLDDLLMCAEDMYLIFGRQQRKVVQIRQNTYERKPQYDKTMT